MIDLAIRLFFAIDALLSKILVTLFLFAIPIVEFIKSQAFKILLKQLCEWILIVTSLRLVFDLGTYLHLRLTGQAIEAAKLAIELKAKYLAAFSDLKRILNINVFNFFKRAFIGYVAGASLLCFNTILLAGIATYAPAIPLFAVPSFMITYFDALVIYAPILEEIVFRFMLIESLRRIEQVVSKGFNFLATQFKIYASEFATRFGYQAKSSQPEAQPATVTTPVIEPAQAKASEEQPDAANVAPQPRQPSVPSIIFSAALFSAGHTGGIGQNIATFFGGLMLGTLYETGDGDLIAPIAAHMTNNGTIYADSAGYDSDFNTLQSAFRKHMRFN